MVGCWRKEATLLLIFPSWLVNLTICVTILFDWLTWAFVPWLPCKSYQIVVGQKCDKRPWVWMEKLAKTQFFLAYLLFEYFKTLCDGENFFLCIFSTFEIRVDSNRSSHDETDGHWVFVLPLEYKRIIWNSSQASSKHLSNFNRNITQPIFHHVFVDPLRLMNFKFNVKAVRDHIERYKELFVKLRTREKNLEHKKNGLWLLSSYKCHINHCHNSSLTKKGWFWFYIQLDD